MPIPYPSSPTVGQTFTYGGITYTWNGVAWIYTQTNTPAVVGSVAVTAPITNTGTPTAPVIGINQSALSITKSQVSDFSSGTVASASVAGTASYADTAGTSVNISGTIAQSQVTNLVTDLAGKANLVGGNTFVGAQIVTVSGTASIPLVVRGTAGQSGNLLQIETSISTAIRVNSVGNTTFVGNITSQNNALFTPASTATVPFAVQGASGQSAYLTEWRNNTGGTVIGIDSSGVLQAFNGVRSNSLTNITTFSNARIQTGNTGTIIDTGIFNNPALRVQNTNSTATANLQEWLSSAGGTVLSVNNIGSVLFSGSGSLLSGTNGRGLFITNSTAIVPMTVRGAASQSANLQEWQVDGGTVRSFVNNIGRVGIRTASLFNGAESLAVAAINPTDPGIIIRGAASQSADYLQVQNSAGATAVKIDSAGDITARVFRSTLAARIATNDTTVAPMVITTIASQTSNSTEWQNNAGTVAYMQAGGNFKANNIATFNSQLQMAQNAGGGLQIWSRATAAYSNPGANFAATYFRDGTLAGTLRFVSITGASGVEETLIDNISSGTAVASARFTGAGGINTAGSVISSAGFSLSGTVAPILLNGSAGTSGQVLTSGGAGTTPTWTTVGGGGGSFTGGTLTSDLVLAAGSTAVEPLTFQANTSTVGTVSGAMEYDGTVFYQTSNTNPGKALATQNYYYVSSADYGPDFTINSTAKSLLGGSTIGLTVAAGTTYEYELITAISHQYVTATSISGDYLIVSTTVSGSPVVSTTHQVDYGSNTTGFTTATTLSTVRPTGNVTFMPSITSGTRYAFLRAKGLIRVTGTGTVKIYPAMQTSGASGSGDNIWNVKSGTIFKLTPVGNGTVTQVGAFA